MPYFPINPQADNRRQAQAATPMDLINCQIERAPAGAGKRAPFFLAPTPGRTRVATLPDNVRGLFCEPGCREGHLFTAAGSSAYEVSSSYGYAVIGAITGGDVVTFRAFRDDVVLRAFGELYLYTGAAFTNITDVDAPTFASTLAVVGFRVTAAESTLDSFSWSKAGDALDWDASGTAADIDLPDPIVGQEEFSGDLWNFGSRSTTVWQATGGSEAEAFARIPGADMRRGLAARDAVARMGDGGMLLGDDRVVYGTSGLSMQAIPNRDLEIALRALTEAEIESNCIAWSYRDGSKEFWGLNAGLEYAFVRDSEVGLWHKRARYETAVYDIDFAVRAFGKTIVASKNAPYLWELDPDVFTDDGDILLRTFTVKVPVSGDASVDRIVLDAEWRGQPLTGQGSAPVIMLEVSMDGGNSWCDPRMIDLPRIGEYGLRVQDFAFGMSSSEHGALFHFTLSDPLGFAIYGIYVNPSPEEIP